MPLAKLTTQQVNLKLSPQGHSLVGEWQGFNKLNVFKCSKGHQWSVQGHGPVSRKTGCPECYKLGGYKPKSKEKRSKPKRLTELEMQTLLAQRGIKIVDKLWQGGNRRYDFICQFGHQWKSMGNNLLSGSGCPRCQANNSGLSEVEIKARLKTLGLKLGEEWQGTQIKTLFVCVAAGHEWNVVPNSLFTQHKGCIYCIGHPKLTTDEINVILTPRGISLKDKWKGANRQNTFVCTAGHEWTTAGRSVVEMKRDCPECTGHVWPEQLTRDAVVARLAIRGLGLEGPWSGIRKDATFKCTIGHTWTVKAHGPVVQGTGCPECYRLRNKNRSIA